MQGNVGKLCLASEGWSTVIVRTKRGESIFNEAVKDGAIEVERMEPEVFVHLVQLASYEQDSAFKEIRECLRGLHLKSLDIRFH
ncbi:MAG: Coenzyme F420 hydrogenase/dehydrogenase, beta subunit C-terminal domain [Candidatus Bathyarchaeia archaeon]